MEAIALQITVKLLGVMIVSLNRFAGAPTELERMELIMLNKKWCYFEGWSAG